MFAKVSRFNYSVNIFFIASAAFTTDIAVAIAAVAAAVVVDVC